MDTANFEPTVPSPLSLEKKREFFVFTDPATDKYPPHLNLAANKPANDDVAKVQGSSLSPGDLFDKLRLAQLTTLLPAVIPKTFIAEVGAKVGQAAAWAKFGGMGRPDKGDKLSDIEAYNNTESSKWWYQKDIFDLPNIGNLPDWYSDARFAQQQFTGANPTTIKKAGEWVKIFIDAATDPKDKTMKDKITKRAVESPNSLYVQDYSSIRDAAGLNDLSVERQDTYEENGQTKQRVYKQYCVAAICLFNLADNGVLEPLAIIIDWRGNAKDSVFIFNRELDKTGQKEDWPWRYGEIISTFNSCSWQFLTISAS
jgi:hypothetical protein